MTSVESDCARRGLSARAWEKEERERKERERKERERKERERERERNVGRMPHHVVDGGCPPVIGVTCM